MHAASKTLTKAWIIVFGFTFLAQCLAGCSGLPVPQDTAVSSLPQPAERLTVDGIDLFARIDTDVYRGAAPTQHGLRALARAHVKTIICLRDTLQSEKTATDLGLRIAHLPLSPYEEPSHEAIRRFLEITTDPAQKPVFFHCRYGRERTGAMAALYRMQIQGWSQDQALQEMKDFGFDPAFVDLKNFIASYEDRRLKAALASNDSDGKALVEAGNQLLAAGHAQNAMARYRSALETRPSCTDARLGLAQALSQTGTVSQAFVEARQAMILAGSQNERIRVARITIKILAEASLRGDLPPDAFGIAEREWVLLEMHDAEDRESLLRLGEIYQRGLHLSRALEAFERATARGGIQEQEIEGRAARIRAVHSYAPRSALGKRLGLMPRVTRGELAALLVQEFRADRLRSFKGSATWQRHIAHTTPAPSVTDIADSPHKADIVRVLALGMRGLEPFADHTFRPTDPVSRAEFVVIFEDMLTRATRDQTLPTQMLGRTRRFDDVKAGVWYESAANLARTLGLFAPAHGDTPNLRPLDPVTGLETLQAFRLLRKRLDTRARAVVVVVDALRAESAYGPLDEGHLPNLSRLIRERGVVRFEKCLSALPSVTLPNHTTIFTGVYPGRHGIPGNEWFDRTLDAGVPFYRRTREYVKYGAEDDPGLGRSWSFGGVPVHDMDLAAGVRTIYEAFEEAETRRGREARTAVVFDPVRRGADTVVNPDLIDAIISLDVLPFVNHFAVLDASAMTKAIELIRDDDPPELLGIWLSGLDGWSHAHGPGPVGGADDRQAGYMIKNIDPLIGNLVAALRDRGLLDETVIILASDHGQADAAGKKEYAIDAEKVYGALAGSPYRLPLDKDGHLNDHAIDFDVAIMANSNGNAALVSIRSPGASWQTPPTRADLNAVAMLMLKEPYVSRIFFLEPQPPGPARGVIMLTRGNNGPTETRLDQESEERLISRALGLAGSGRSGDLLVEVRSPYYFSPWGSIYHGQHGRGERMEDHVPLLILNPPGGRRNTVESVVEIADISPTVAGTLGFLEFMDCDGQDLLDPPRIIISSHTEDQPVPAGQVISILGFAQDAVGIERIEFRMNDEEHFTAASGSSFWEAKVALYPGRHAITLRAIDETGLQSTVRFHLIAR